MESDNPVIYGLEFQVTFIFTKFFTSFHNYLFYFRPEPCRLKVPRPTSSDSSLARNP